MTGENDFWCARRGSKGGVLSLARRTTTPHFEMPMTEARVGDQTVRYDREATAAIYWGLEHGFAEKCGCMFCKNFAIQREAVYPASFRALLDQLGVDPNKEAEAFEYGPVEDGCHLYGGWFYFVGEMVTAGDQSVNAPDSHHFEYFFTSIGPPFPAFRGGPRLSIEFTTHVKWVLPESPQYKTTSGKTITFPKVIDGPET